MAAGGNGDKVSSLLSQPQNGAGILPERKGHFWGDFLQGKKETMQKRDSVTFDGAGKRLPSCGFWRKTEGFPKKSLAFPRKGCYTASRQFNNGSC